MTKDSTRGGADPRPPGRDGTERPYAGVVMAMGTMHGKQHQVAPAFADVLGARVLVPAGLDTDQFGTFTGDVERTLSPRQAAAAKARLAMTVAGVSHGLASEASYGTAYGFLTVHEEVLLFLDDTRGIEVIEGEYCPDTPGPSAVVTCATEAALTARRFGFPHQGASVKVVAAGHVRVVGKGLTDGTRLTQMVQTALGVADTGQVWVEPDLRAHHNPTRRQVLTRLAERLAHRLATPCPACHTPGYGKVDVRRGLPCTLCGSPTSVIAADVHGCPACEHRHGVPRHATGAEPRWCDYCNP